MPNEFKLFDALRIVKLENGESERPVYYSQTGRNCIRIGDVCVKIADWLGGKVRVEAVTPTGEIDWQDHIPADCLERIEITSAPYCRRRIHESWAWSLGLVGSQVKAREWTNALDLARKVMAFARTNVDVLIRRLHSGGYQFASQSPHVLPTPDCVAKIRELEDRGFHIPIALQGWLMEVGRVDLSGSHPNWARSAYSGILDEGDEREPWYSDPLVVYVDIESLMELDDVESVVEIAPDDVTKANVSGGAPIHFSTSERAFDSVMIGQHGSFTFHSYLQHAFLWGGFPGFQYISDAPHDTLKQLAAGLIRL